MIVLDTDHITELQYPNSVRGARLLGRLGAVPSDELATTIVSFEEPMRGWLAAIHREPAGLPSGGVHQPHRSRAVLSRVEYPAVRPGRGGGVPPTHVKDPYRCDGSEDCGDRAD